jgi:MauM/NapG family ferredoxin protein
MRILRIYSQITFFILFAVLIIFLCKYPHAYSIDCDIFLKVNPLTSLLVFLSSHSILIDTLIISGSVFLITIMMGRVFCGYFCPLGALIDFTDKIFSNMRSNKRRPPLYFHRFKYILLISVAVLAVFGVIFPLFFDPISLVTKFFTYIFDPVFRIILRDGQQLSGLISTSIEDYFYRTFTIKQVQYYAISATLLLMLIVLGGTFWDKRFWCQYICPTGAFLGIIGRFSLFRRHVIETKCNSCSNCARQCPVHAINEKNIKKYSPAECIECGICVTLKDHCSRFTFKKPVDRNDIIEPDIKRRHLLAGVTGGLVLIPVFRAAAVNKTDAHGRLIRPPGAIPEKDFLKRCIACGECCKVCPTNTLQPAVFTDGFNRLYTPKVVPKIAGCEDRCALCGHVCPTGAIRTLQPEDKPFVKIGTAVLDRHRCIAWEQNKECVVCDEICPYNAIDARDIETIDGIFKVPVVKEDLCMGCGMCEQECPVTDQAAIVVYRFGENRKLTGPYMPEEKKRMFTELRKKTGLEKTEKSKSDASYEVDNGTHKPENTENALPEGFE